MRPEFARLLGTPRTALKLFSRGHPIRGTIALASGITEMILWGLFGIGLLCFLASLSFFMSGMFLVLVESGRRMAGYGPADEAFYIPVCLAAWIVALAFNLIWGSSGIRRSLPSIAAGRRLAKFGAVLGGQVVSCASSSQLHHNGWHDEVLASFAMHYTFVTPAGKKLAAWVGELPACPTKGWNPEPGEPIAILYADDENFQVL